MKIPVIIGGTRTFDLGIIMPYVLSPILPIIHNIEIIEGGASGADYLARLFAKYYKIPYRTFEADWDTYGKAAGPKRNTQMGLYAHEHGPLYGKPGYYFGFWDGKSHGTADMIEKARNYKLTTIVHRYMPLKFYHKQLLMDWQNKFKAA